VETENNRNVKACTVLGLKYKIHSQTILFTNLYATVAEILEMESDSLEITS